jgi:hypothetical protein
MANTPLTAGTIITHRHFGKGKVICQYEDINVGDMVEVHWFDNNEVLDHREENLRFGLQTIQPCVTNAVSPWLSLLEEE